ncbi:XdhC/CoxI family protein [Actinoplanes sp. TRM 88003]|uniref:XdhC/CoxI family protein n=1 Tax=Paractinoplanes aksuensis TaxID=2939490 RepID=A0ABT1DR29_9ACTN|nr:XdhC family protein [Actinoplanes aksuensis]MCO8273299.1 XdhC/CoxI family protein [Actinoplanes aksuensis]
MRDVLDALLKWWQADIPVGLATVTATWSSAPRQPGAAMVVGPDGEVVGSVSGGCVEGAVYELCREVIETGAARTARFGVSDDDAFEVGLTCGGTIELLIERVDRESFPQLPALARAIAESRPVALLTRIPTSQNPPVTSTSPAPSSLPDARQLLDLATSSAAPDSGPRTGLTTGSRDDAPGAANNSAAPREANTNVAPGNGRGPEPEASGRGDVHDAASISVAADNGRSAQATAGSWDDARGPVSADGARGSAPEDGSLGAGRHLLITPDGRDGSLGGDRIDDAATDDGRGLLAAGRTGVLHYGPSGERRGEGLSVLVASFAPPARMLVFGATDHAAATARIGSFLGYHVTVCDARPVFATARRFPSADEVVVDWPHRYLIAEVEAGRIDERTVLCVLTHDPKFDVPVLEVALRLPVAYVGAMGSRRTHDDRNKRLQEAGVADADLHRLASPVGLDLGARTPEETAVSIAAEIVALRWGGTGARLTATEGRIHGE